MFVVTADQINSTGDRDRVPAALESVADLADSLEVPAARYAGDELQFVTRHASTALEIVLRLRRDDHWSTGLGVGSVIDPMPATAAEASGPAFVRGREAIDAAKRSPTRFTLIGAPDAVPDGDQVGALVDLLLTLRARRSPEGWAVTDMIAAGMSQTAAAERLGITPQAVSLRLRAAGWRIEERARPGLVVLLERLDAATPQD
ncbi:DNA-binding protein [Amnibacterium flavum]|uniref:DNA-binding protein n=1 Tax=Amnibacterium flavum TaxID=2173173 RepID=A0A2V1HR91_9MICO|nr:DNA-binding protein [Amnibacterium flavum]PVZ93490.1 DNA-binding protein [Amnibacterium flavum]